LLARFGAPSVEKNAATSFAVTVPTRVPELRSCRSDRAYANTPSGVNSQLASGDTPQVNLR